MDAFQEFYHAPVLHANQSPTAYSKAAREAGFEAPHYRIEGPHRLVSTSGIRAWEMADEMRKPIEDICRSGLFGPWDKPDLGRCPRASIRREMRSLGPRFVPAVPQLRDPDLGAGLVSHLSLLADVAQHHTFRGHAVLPAAARRASASPRNWPRFPSRSTALQDANTLEATQTMVESRVVGQLPALRPGGAHPPPAQGDGGVGRRLPAQDAGRAWRLTTSCRPSSPISSRSRTGACHRGRAVRQAAGQLDGRDAGLLRRDHRAPEEAIAYCDQVPARRHARRRAQPDAPAVLDDPGVVPVECWKQPRVPTRVPPRWTACQNRFRDSAVTSCARSAGPTSRPARCGHRPWS